MDEKENEEGPASDEDNTTTSNDVWDGGGSMLEKTSDNSAFCPEPHIQTDINIHSQWNHFIEF